MINPEKTLNHIALYVTNLERSIQFYRNILLMEVTDPISPSEQPGIMRFASGAVSRGGPMQYLVKSISPQCYLYMHSRIAFCKAGSEWNILLIEQKNPEKGYVISVDGNTIYGFGCSIKGDRDIEDLAWDLEIAGADFRFGDLYSDGIQYTKDSHIHTLFVRDPDGRMIELIPEEKFTDSNLITGLHHIILHVSAINPSKEYYISEFGFRESNGSEMKMQGSSRMIHLGVCDSSPVVILYEKRNADMTLEIVGGHGLDHFALSGCRVHDRKGQKGAYDIRMDPDKFGEKTNSVYLQDPNNYWIECQ